MNHFQLNRVDSLKLDSYRVSHKKKFVEKVEELIYTSGFLERIALYCKLQTSYE